jgi:ABC-2 type transport system permease protein
MPLRDALPSTRSLTLARIATQALAIAQRILTEQWRQRRGLAFWAVFPATMLLLFGSIYGHSPTMRPSLDATAGGVLIGAALFFSCLGGTLTILATERERGTLRRLLVSPLQPAAYFLGIALALSVIAAGQTLLVFGLSSLIGGTYRGSVWLGAAIILMSVLSYVGLGFLFGCRYARRVEDINGPLSAFGVPLLVLAGSFFPLQLMPDFLLKLAQLDPILHMNEALKGVAAQGLGVDTLWPQLAFLFLFCVVSLGLGMGAYGRLLRAERGL